MKKLALIVDPFSSGNEYARRFRENGFVPMAVISSRNLHRSYLKTFKEDEFESVYWWEDDSVGDEFLKSFRPDCVVAGSEPGVELADRMTQYYGLPSNDLSLSSSRRDKDLMSRVLEDKGIRTIRGIKCKTVKAAESFCAKSSLSKYVIKPSRSAGSDHVQVCKTPEEVLRSVEAVLGRRNITGVIDDGAIVQEYIDGEEYVVDCISLEGRHHVSAMYRYQKSTLPNGAIVYDTLELIPSQGSLQASLIDYTLQAIEALGFRNGPSHNELFVDDRGPVLIESGARPHGGLGGPYISRLCMGYNQVDLVVSHFAGTGLISQVFDKPYAFQKKGLEVFLRCPKEGTLKDGFPEDAFSGLETFDCFQFYFGKNEIVPKTVDLVSSPGRLILASESREKIEADVQRAREIEQRVFAKIL